MCKAKKRIILQILALLPCSAHAIPVLDQHHVPLDPVNGSAAIHSVVEWAQTFTVGISGRLVRIELLAGRDIEAPQGNLLIDVRPTIGGAPSEDNETVLYSATVSPTALPHFSDFPLPFEFLALDLGPGIPVLAGDVPAIVLRSPESLRIGYGWGLTTCEASECPDLYPFGEAFVNVGGEGWRRSQLGIDAVFRTYVDPTDLPAPSSLALLLAAGLAGIGFSARRKAGSQVNLPEGAARRSRG
jgi:hypothetical protein